MKGRVRVPWYPGTTTGSSDDMTAHDDTAGRVKCQPYHETAAYLYDFRAAGRASKLPFVSISAKSGVQAPCLSLRGKHTSVRRMGWGSGSILAALGALACLGVLTAQPRPSDGAEPPGNSFRGERNLLSDARNATRPLLTSFGQSIRNMIIATIESSPSVCFANSTDWRATLPRYLARVLHPQAEVAVWQTQLAARYAHYRDRCEHCTADGLNPNPFSCTSWLASRGAGFGKADAVLMISSGTPHSCKHSFPPCHPGINQSVDYGELRWNFEQPWAGHNTQFMLLPISRFFQHSLGLSYLTEIDDADWIKPVVLPDVDEFERRCMGAYRQKNLMYIARYVTTKGQLTFLEAADPALLKGWTVEFASTSHDTEYIRKMQALADKKGISVNIHSSALSREQLQERMCSSRGTIHYAHQDANPRSLYESLVAGLPVLITKESKVPEIFHTQRFVHVTSYHKSSHDKTNKALSDFLRYLEGEGPDEIKKAAFRFAGQEILDESKAFHHVCKGLKICASENPSTHEQNEML